MFIVALFTIAKTWKQPKCLPRDEWIKKMWYIYTMEYYSAIKKNEIRPFAATWMDLEIVILSEVREEQILRDIASIGNLKLSTKQKQTDSRGKRIWLPKGNGGRDKSWYWITRCILLYIKQRNDRDLL